MALKILYPVISLLIYLKDSAGLKLFLTYFLVFNTGQSFILAFIIQV